MTRISDLEPTIVPALADVMVVSDGQLTKKITLENLKDLIVNPAGSNVLGSVKVGNGLQISDTGVLSVRNYQAYVLPPATTSTLGGIRVGPGLTIDNTSILSLDLPIASASSLGAVKVGTGLTISPSGILSASFPDYTSYDDTGLTVGNDSDLKIYVESGTSPTLFNQEGGSLSFMVTDDGSYPNVHFISGEVSASLGVGSPDKPALIPDYNEPVNLGVPLYKWNTIYATNLSVTNFLGTINGNINGTAENANKMLLSGNYVPATIANIPLTIVGRDGSGNISANQFIGSFSGTATQADSLLVGAVYRSASTANTADTVAARDANGDLFARYFDGTAVRARYADLAEKYESDADYDEGTVVVFGGIKEITESTMLGDTRVAGVVSSKPAYIMNVDSNGIPVALRGKVPVKVVGTVSKGDLLVTGDLPGHAVSVGDDYTYGIKIFAKSLEDSSVMGPKKIMAVVL